jgi:hypothetical protein
MGRVAKVRYPFARVLQALALIVEQRVISSLWRRIVFTIHWRGSQEAGFAIGMQRTQPHPSTAAEAPDRLPILSLQIVQQRNLLFQLVQSLAIHGLLASSGRIRHSALRSQARMVGVRKKCMPGTPAFAQHHTLSNLRCTHRRKVDGSGRRAGSWQCGATCSTESPAQIRSQASCRHRRV